MGRYLLMASSRPGTMPANLQGIWNERIEPFGNADYHLNINFQMNYWPADVANLSEMHAPLWDLVDNVRPRGRTTAREHYNARGFVTHVATDAWWGSDTAGMWPTSAGWLARHLWDAYLFNRDVDFLRERGYPIMKEAAEFFLDWLVAHPDTGLLVSGPSSSPESRFRTAGGAAAKVTMGPAMDQQVIRELFVNVLAAAAELEITDDFTAEVQDKLVKLAEPQVGAHGRLLEWPGDPEEVDPGHRHLSHLYGLYPGSLYTVRGTPELTTAAKASLMRRQEHVHRDAPGWHHAWVSNLWARLEAGEKAHEALQRLLTDMTMDNLLGEHPSWGFPFRVFQVDGNLGATAGIAEMLLQSHAGEIHLLPALPAQWRDGVVEGLKARGGFEVSMAWSDGELTTVSIRSRSGEECRVRVTGGEVRTLAVGMGETRWFDVQLSEVRAPQGLAGPRNVAVTGSTATSLSVTWQPPLFEGRSVYGYDVQYAKRGESGFREWPHRGRASGTTITGLEGGAAYKARVRARNASGPGAWSTAGDIVAPPPPSPPPGPPVPRTSAPGSPRNLTAAGGNGEVVLTWEAPASDDGSEITDYEYRIDRRGDWISIGSTATTHTVAGLVNGTTYVFQVRAVNRIGRSGPSLPAEATPIAQVVLDLAHFANGAGIISEVVLVNVAPHPIQPALYFYDQEGEPIAAESMVDVLGDLGIQEDGGLTIRTEMEPLGELTISTHGRGDLVSGSVKVAAYGAIGGVLRFDLPGIGVAGVQVSQTMRDAIFPVRRREGGINTGMALHNREEEAAVVSCRLMKNGAVLEEVEITLAANGQVARFIWEVFTGTDTSDFVGLVRCTAEGVAQFTGMALELDAGNRIFTTLPVVEVNRGRAGEAALDFAHFANGASIVSEMVFMNLETQPSGPPLSPFHQAIPPTRPVIYFYDQEGNPIDPALLVDLTGDLEITEDGALSIQSEMGPLEELTISTHGRGELVSGSVRVVSDGPIGGVLRFDLPGIGVAGVGASHPVRDAIFPARRQAGGISTAAAIHNLGEEALVVGCQLMKDGAVLEEEEIPLEANGQEALYIEQMFTRTDTSDFVGSVRCMVPAEGEGMFTGVAVELDAGNQIFTTLPVVPVPETRDRE